MVRAVTGSDLRAEKKGVIGRLQENRGAEEGPFQTKRSMVALTRASVRLKWKAVAQGRPQRI